MSTDEHNLCKTYTADESTWATLFIRLRNDCFLFQYAFNATTTALTAPKIQIVIRIGNRLIIICAGIVNQLHTLFFSDQNTIDIIQTILHIDSLLKIENGQHKSDRKIIVAYLICSQTFLALQLYFISVLQHTGTLIVAMYSFSVYVNLGVAATELQYIAICQVIRSRYALINQKIKIFKNQLKNGMGDFENEIETLRYAHRILVTMTERTNRSFDLRLFFSFFCCMTNVLANLYFMIFGETYIFEPEDYQQKIQYVMLTFLWALYYFMRMTLLCLASQTLCKEVGGFFLLLQAFL